MNKQAFIFLIFIYIVLQNLSCKAIYGVKQQTKIDDELIQEFYDEFSFQKFEKATIDKKYSIWVRKKFEGDSRYISFHSQPLQVLYFDSTLNLVSFHVNCNAGGFPNLKWNKRGLFNTFPAKTQTQIKYNFNFDSLQKKLDIKPESKAKTQYTVVVFWNLLLEKQSKRLVEIVLKNLKLTNQTTTLILVNNDRLFLSQ